MINTVVPLKRFSYQKTPKNPSFPYLKNNSKNAFKRRGRPYSQITLKAKKLIQKHPHISPKELARILHLKKRPTTKSKDQFDYTRHARVILHRYNNNKPNINNNNIHRHSIHSQPLPTDPYDMILSYIYTKERQTKRFREYFADVTQNRYKNTLGQHRYDNDYLLSTKDRRGRTRKFIQRLWNRETPISKNHVHYHNTKPKIIEYHIGSHQNHDLTKYLCAMLGLPYKSRIYLPNHGYFSTDCSGIDCSDLRILYLLLTTNLETQLEGISLLKSCFNHGKLMVKNDVKHVW